MRLLFKLVGKYFVQIAAFHRVCAKAVAYCYINPFRGGVAALRPGARAVRRGNGLEVQPAFLTIKKSVLIVVNEFHEGIGNAHVGRPVKIINRNDFEVNAAFLFLSTFCLSLSAASISASLRYPCFMIISAIATGFEMTSPAQSCLYTGLLLTRAPESNQRESP